MKSCWFVILAALDLLSLSEGTGGSQGGARGADRVVYTQVDTCSPTHQASVWESVIRCRPRPTLVELPLPTTPGDSGSILQVIPGHVTVDRCSGSCSAPSHSCMPTETENATVEVMAVQTTYDAGAWHTLCSLVQVERHLACQCGCKVRQEHCDQATQYYDGSGCQCRCKDQVSRVECLSSGKHWDDASCSCMCPQRTWRTCSTGFTFDYFRSCACVRTYAAAAGGGLTALVALSSAALLALGGAMIHLKRRRERQARLLDDGAMANVQNDLREAFAEEGGDEEEGDRQETG